MFDRKFSFFLLFAATAIAFDSTAYAEPHRDQCVILVSVDGLANFFLDDPRAELKTLRRLAAEGARADGMTCSFPTVTWPNHTTLVTGVPPAKHGVIGNNYLDRASGDSVPLIPDPLFDKDEIVKVPTIYDAAHAAGLKTAAVIWPASRNAKSLDWTVPDMGGDGWTRFGTPSWIAELREAGLPVDMQAEWVKAPSGGVQRDWLYTRLAAHALKHHAPNLLLIHLVEVDHVLHRVGPGAPDAYWAVSYADDRLRDLVEAVDDSPFKGRATIFVCSDHGFFPIDKEIRPNVVLRQLGLIETSGGKAVKKHAWCMSQGGASAVYLLESERRSEVAAQLKKQLAELPGVEAVFEPKDFGKIGQPTPSDDPHAPDLWLAAKKDYSFSDSFEGDNPVTPRSGRAGTHGYDPKHADLLGTCVVWGPSVKAGTKLGRINNEQIAPTIARVLGVEFPSSDAKPLDTNPKR